MLPRPEPLPPHVTRDVRRALRKMENLCAKSLRQAQRITTQEVVTEDDRFEFEESMLHFQSEMKNLAADSFVACMEHISHLCRQSDKPMLQGMMLVSEFDIDLNDLKEKPDDD